MRTIKFRLIKDNKIISTQELKPNGIIDCPVEWDIAYQFTGLLDRQGKEIYEGDIVSWGWQGEEQGEVVFADCQFKIKYKHGFMYFTHPDAYEVIGNIYESEVLK